jgi:hypothetical protein
MILCLHSTVLFVTKKFHNINLRVAS